jgi:biotin carboxyl carrier protein
MLKNLLDNFENKRLRLKEDIRTDAPMDLKDILNAKIALNSLGYYKAPSWGITPYTDEALFLGIKSLQKANGLKVDGIIKPEGETETTMNELNKNFSGRNYSDDSRTSFNDGYSRTIRKDNFNKNEQYEENKPKKIVKYVFEARGSNSCDKCMKYDGQIFDNKEDAPKLPIHPNCKCKLHEVVSYKDSESELGNNREIEYKVREKDSFGSGEFGASRDGGKRKHAGVDIVSKPGEKVKAISNGKVIKINSPYGDGVYKGVDIKTEDGKKERYFYVDPKVKQGDIIKKGDVLGNTQDIARKYNRPNAKMTNHYHYEIRDKSGKPIDPTERIHLL